MSSENSKGSKGKKADPISVCMVTGMSIGMCLGLAIGFAIRSDSMPPTIFMLFGMSVGMCLGLSVGSMKKKKDNSNDGK